MAETGPRLLGLTQQPFAHVLTVLFKLKLLKETNKRGFIHFNLKDETQGIMWMSYLHYFSNMPLTSFLTASAIIRPVNETRLKAI